ncbi:33542_t:CDS:2, partial [Racocetra persica]
PTTFASTSSRITNHADLPTINNELSITLKLNIASHGTDWTLVFRKAYTLSNTEKRMDVYVDGIWAGFTSVEQVLSQSVIFNDSPLYIGKDSFFNGITGQISNNCSSPTMTTATPLNNNYPKTTNGECSNGILAGSIVGSFVCGGLIFLAGNLFLRKYKKRNSYYDSGNQVVFTQQ